MSGKCLLRFCLLWVLASSAQLANALEVTLSAQYRGGGSGRFDNTTPAATNCSYYQGLCITNMTVDIPITYSKRTTKGAADQRDLFYIKTPARREVDVYHDQTGEPHRLALEITAVGQMVGTANYWRNPVASGRTMGGCTHAAGLGWESARRYMYLWRVSNPRSPSPCTQESFHAPAGHVEQADTSQMAVAYTLELPPAYRLKPGMYRGSVTFKIGPGGDFDFGNDVTELSGDSLMIHFVLDVEHAFIFDFPPGSDRAVLEPAGGWMAWLNGGRVPQRLYRDLPMRVWSTGPIKVYKLCEYDHGDRCAIRDDSNDEVPVQVALSLPEGIRYRGGLVQRLALPTGRAAALQFESVMPAINRPGALHFDVAREDVRFMLDRPGKTYNGKVTVVFDAEI